MAQTGDTLHVFFDLNNNQILEPDEEVRETRSGTYVVSDEQRQIICLDLNASTEDSDGDGLPDAWERSHFGDLRWSATDSPAHDGISNLVAMAAGLDPTIDKSRFMPFLQNEPGGQLAYYYRVSAAVTSASVRVVSSDTLIGRWDPVSGPPRELSTWNGSTLYRLVIPEGIDRPRRFFRLAVTPNAP